LSAFSSAAIAVVEAIGSSRSVGEREHSGRRAAGRLGKISTWVIEQTAKRKQAFSFKLRILVGMAVLCIAASPALFARANQHTASNAHAGQRDVQIRHSNRAPFGLSGGVRQAWAAIYSGVFDEEAAAIAVDGVGNVYVTGYSGAPDSYHYVTIKYNAFGQEAWEASYNIPLGISFARAIAIDRSGNVYVTGTSGTFALGDNDYATIKYNNSGQQQWIARYSGPNNANDSATAIAVDRSGNVYVTGSSENGYATIKYDSLGQQQWVANYNTAGRPVAIADDSLGNVYLTGTSAGGYVTIKYDGLGQEDWVALYTAVADPVALAVDAAGNVYVTGTRSVSGAVSDYATIKYDNSGQQQWVAEYNGTGNGTDQAAGIGIDGSGNVYVTGTSVDSGGLPNYATIKYDSGGQQQWVARYMGPDNLGDYATAIAMNSSGNVYVTGESWSDETGSDYATIKYDSSGQEQWTARYNGPDNLEDYPVGIAIDRLGNAYVTGASRADPIQYNWDYATVKYTADRAPQPHPRPTP
jgi:hypothetical protein